MVLLSNIWICSTQQLWTPSASIPFRTWIMCIANGLARVAGYLRQPHAAVTRHHWENGKAKFAIGDDPSMWQDLDR